jgi:hypothetical protein
LGLLGLSGNPEKPSTSRGCCKTCDASLKFPYFIRVAALALPSVEISLIGNKRYNVFVMEAVRFVWQALKVIYQIL